MLYLSDFHSHDKRANMNNMNPNAPIFSNHSVPAPKYEYKSVIISLIWDIVLNATILVACYFLVKRFVSPSELTALIAPLHFQYLKVPMT